MNRMSFQAEDWIYVPDALGRVGQGYYKKRSNPTETITSAEFERRRAAPVAVTEKNNEQNINKIMSAPAQAGVSAGSDAMGARLVTGDGAQ